MSVVNKMLQDLEARQDSPEVGSADYQPPKRNMTKLLWLAVLLVIVLFVAGGGYYWSVVVASRTNQSGSQQMESGALGDIAAPESTTANQPELADAVEQKMRWIEAPNTELKNAANGREIATAQSDTEVTIAVDVAPLSSGTSIATAEVTHAGTSNMPTADNGTLAKATFSKQTNRTDNIQAGLKQSINQALREGKTLTAIDGLQKLLSSEPENLRVRKKLAALLFAENRMAEAQALLTEGLTDAPQQHDLRLMLARLFTQQNSPEKALSLLLEVSPSLTLHSDIYAYRGALAQRTASYAQAQQDYQKLVNAEPEKAKWWLGLGIAQESLGQNSQALASYHKADNEQQLSPEVITFVRQRLNDLVGIE
ncbi:tetratricopeptide repeat protein [Paraglaciecola polaris]|uniref:MSHA biogenesis protein MshN n=2 Tax=Paraglaciecola polaris TaxID=222814 RepID=K6ZZD6_9ALTE|nr:tetratricopeptide repeat protein [Paraglaciecola polaris]GAC34108.1 MSHA biogenesis protein MshN [Paraglaciecola polaris LMG 21857]|tara:strand:+ start:14008 stop:15111 length:1104 start_codon:yes stop_codon:yes gene_type:complete